MKRVFYVCSYGGCGSKLLCDYLKLFGEVKHIHSRYPPLRLEYVGNEMGGDTYSEWFNGIQIPENELYRYTVIYIYKDPVRSIYSRFKDPGHLVNIGTDKNIKIEDVASSKKDLYGLYEFYGNYMRPNVKRNYKIICVRYEDLFEKLGELNKALRLINTKITFPKLESKREYEYQKELDEVYYNLKVWMNINNFIEIR